MWEFWLYVCVCVCAPLPEETRRGHQIPWSWHYRQLWAMRILGIEPHPLEEQQVLFTIESSLQTQALLILTMGFFSPLRKCVSDKMRRVGSLVAQSVVGWYLLNVWGLGETAESQEHTLQGQAENASASLFTQCWLTAPWDLHMHLYFKRVSSDTS